MKYSINYPISGLPKSKISELSNSKTLVLFDFDGTLTTRDSMVEFLIFSVGYPRLILAAIALFPKLVAYFLSKKPDGNDVKPLLFSKLFAGKTRQELENLGQNFFEKKIPKMLRAEMMEKLEGFKKEKAVLVLVSASLDFWLKPFAEAHGMHLICTEIQYQNEVFLGKFSTQNCNYSEKARRVKSVFDLKKFEKIYAFGNSDGDDAMLALADVNRRLKIHQS